MTVVKLSKPAKLSMPVRYRVQPTPEMLTRANAWLERPLPENCQAFADTIRDLDAILASARETRLCAAA